MFPIIADTSSLRILLAGNGVATERRLMLLDSAGAKFVKIYSDKPSKELLKNAAERLINRQPEEKDFESISIAMVADYDEETSGKLAGYARKKGVLVNVEDNKKYCDFHVPAIVRRGDLLLTVSTNGASPRLARKLRQMLEKFFSPAWSERIKEIGESRAVWKKAGDGIPEVAAKTDEILNKKGWLKEVCECRAAELVN